VEVEQVVFFLLDHIADRVVIIQFFQQSHQLVVEVVEQVLLKVLMVDQVVEVEME
jgi:hypothetical protein